MAAEPAKRVYGGAEFCTAALFLFALVAPRFPGNMGVLAGAVAIMWLEFILAHAGVMVAGCRDKGLAAIALVALYVFMILGMGLAFGGGLLSTAFYIWVVLRRVGRGGRFEKPEAMARGWITAGTWMALAFFALALQNHLPSFGVDASVLEELYRRRRFQADYGMEQGAAIFCVLWFTAMGIYAKLDFSGVAAKIQAPPET